MDWAQSASLALVFLILEILLVFILAGVIFFTIKLLQPVRAQRKLESQMHALDEVRDWAEVALGLILDSPANDPAARYRLQKSLVVLLVSRRSIVSAASQFGSDFEERVEEASMRLAEYKLALSSDGHRRHMEDILEPCVKSLEDVLDKVTKLRAEF
jgi:hypothetical protein